MPLFTYNALTASGRPLSGKQMAASAEQVESELVEQGLIVQSIRLQTALWRPRRGCRVGEDSILIFNQELIPLLRAGLTIPDSLQLISEQPDQEALSSVISQILDDVRKGKLMSECCIDYPEVFDSAYLATLRTGEKAGDLVPGLMKYQEYYKKKIFLKKKIKQALTYPIFLLATLLGVMLILFVFVMPRFVSMYADFNAELPLPTQLLIHVVDNLSLYSLISIFAFIGAYILYQMFTSSSQGGVKIDRLKEIIPGVGTIVRSANVAQCCRMLSTLLSSGVTLIDSLEITEKSLSNKAYSSRLHSSIKRVSEGEGLSSSMREDDLLTPISSKLISVGEASGRLEVMLSDVADYYEDDVDDRVSRIMSMIEPLLMLLVGVMIGGIIVVMYLPIFSMADVIK